MMAARWHRGRRPIELTQSHAPRFLMLQPAAIFDPIASEICSRLKKNQVHRSTDAPDFFVQALRRDDAD
jgi:hypothetical protein